MGKNGYKWDVKLSRNLLVQFRLGFETYKEKNVISIFLYFSILQYILYIRKILIQNDIYILFDFDSGTL